MCTLDIEIDTHQHYCLKMSLVWLSSVVYVYQKHLWNMYRSLNSVNFSIGKIWKMISLVLAGLQNMLECRTKGHMLRSMFCNNAFVLKNVFVKLIFLVNVCSYLNSLIFYVKNFGIWILLQLIHVQIYQSFIIFCQIAH